MRSGEFGYDRALGSSTHPPMKLYIYFSVHEKLFERVAFELRNRHGLETVGGFVWGKDQEDLLRASPVPWWRLDTFTDWLKSLPGHRLDMDFLRQAESRYGLPTLSRMVYGERHLLKRYGHDDVLKIIEIVIRRWERLFDEDRPDGIFVESIDSLPLLLMYGVARDRGVPIIHLDSGRIDRLVAVTHDPFMTWSDVDQAFRNKLSQPLDAAARERASAFLTSFRETRSRIQTPRRWMYPRPRLDDLRRLAIASRRYLRDPQNPVLTSPWAMARQKATRVMNHIRSSHFDMFEQPVPGEKYVLFPLHYQPEVSTLVMGTFYLDQPALIGDIAKSLPIGYRLYVKEHFFAMGRRPIDEYRRIAKSFNVRLIGPMHDPIKMVENASAVTTIAGTMGWESVLMERPTVTFGDCFYNSYPQVFRAGLVAKTEWPRVFREALTAFTPDTELLLKYIAAILENTYEGYFSFDNPSTDPERCMREENYQNIAGVIANELGLTRRDARSRGAA
jgi:hypothetical protein